MKRLAFLAHRLPYPPDKGERLRAFHEIRALSRTFRLTVAALAHSGAEAEAAAGLEGLCEKVLVAPVAKPAARLRAGWSLLRGRSATAGYFRSRQLASMLAREAAREPFDVAMGYCSSMLGPLLAVPAAGRVMDLVDVDSAKWAAYADAAAWPARWLYRLEARRVAALERRAAAACDAVLLVSEAEADAFGPGRQRPLAIGNGVDLDYYRPAGAEAGPPSLVFTGTMDYRPNVEGVCWFVRRVWPDIRRARPDARLMIVGRDPTRAVQALGAAPGVEVTGSVRDVRPYLWAAAVSVTPLLTARGVQNKVLEAMAVGKAVVATTAALTGLEVAEGRDVVGADTPAQWRQALTALLGDPARRAALGRAARQCVEDRYSWAARLAPLVNLCAALGDRTKPATPHGVRSPAPAVHPSARPAREGSSEKTPLVDMPM